MSLQHFLILLAMFSLTGCSSATPVAGGTKGVLRAGDELLGEIQVTVHQAEGSTWRPIGLGVTAFDGSFELVKNGAQGPLWLPPGEYRCTLESAEAPVVIPEQLAQAESTPLKVTWANEGSLELRAPPLLVQP